MHRLIERIAALEARTARTPSLDIAGARERLRAMMLAHAQGLPLPSFPPQPRTAEGDRARDRLRTMLTRRASAQEARHATV
jgi:hypothetical protein